MTDLDLDRIERDAKAATQGSWAIETCGEKGDGSEMIGVVFGPNDENCEHALSGRLPVFDADGNEIEYYRDELVAECAHRNRNSAADAQHIANMAPPTTLALVAALRKAGAENRTLRNSGVSLLARAEAAEAEAARLRGAVEAAREWKAHTAICAITTASYAGPRGPSPWSEPCTCGFDRMATALAALEAK